MQFWAIYNLLLASKTKKRFAKSLAPTEELTPDTAHLPILMHYSHKVNYNSIHKKGVSPERPDPQRKMATEPILMGFEANSSHERFLNRKLLDFRSLTASTKPEVG